MALRTLHGPVRTIDLSSAEGRRVTNEILENHARLRVRLAAAHTRGARIGPGVQISDRENFDVALANGLDDIHDMKVWLGVYFVTHGSYKVTAHGKNYFASVAHDHIYTETGEHSSDRDRDRTTRIQAKPTIEANQAQLQEQIDAMIGAGYARTMIDSGYIIPTVRWEEPHAIATVRQLVRLLDKDVRQVSGEDFQTHGLAGLITKYSNSIHNIMCAAGLAYTVEETLRQAQTRIFRGEKVHGWEFLRAPKGFWERAEIRIAATQWMIWRQGKEPRTIIQDDFNQSNLNGLLAGSYQGSPYRGLVEAGLAYGKEEWSIHARGSRFSIAKIYPWELAFVPKADFDDDFVKGAVRWLVWKVQKIRELSADDFRRNGLGEVLKRYTGSIYAALVAAEYAHSIETSYGHSSRRAFEATKIYPWEMVHAPHLYENRDIRVGAVRWLIWKRKTRVLDIADFRAEGLRGVLVHYGESAQNAVKDATD